MTAAGGTRSPTALEPVFFETADDFRSWLEQNHESKSELWVGFHKAATGKPTMSWSESVDQAVCFGWIDGVRRSLGDESYAIRFTPRKRGSTWSKVNVQKVADLERRGLMRPAGRRAFDARSPERTGIYAYELERPAELPHACAERLRANPEALAYFESRPPWYRRNVVNWVVSAKRQETRERRLRTLIECSASGHDVPHLRRRS